jgi:regulatory protein
MAGTITALVIQKRNKERVNVYVDGEFAFGLAMIEAVKLHKGQQLSAEEITRLKALDEAEIAHERALGFLAHRPRSVEEIRRYLRGKNVPDAAVAGVVDRLERAGLVDDEAFTRYWIESRGRSKPISARALRYELRKKGVPAPVIEAALEVIDEEALALRAARVVARRFRSLDRKMFRRRLSEALLRRGFIFTVVREVADRLWAEWIEEASSSTHGDSEVERRTEDV